ncbi:hypothetical protein BV898_12722 [Hypsibius exemplaris]|uniref:Uncharacterized protein n=1 Tax=Hypsibius exemplaris TaxID=2072580 RepID=A0A1W0WCW4_HYPEX|nr:hypothetical protein BV898_12722 [Hypsibius exemplaris]
MDTLRKILKEQAEELEYLFAHNPNHDVLPVYKDPRQSGFTALQTKACRYWEDIRHDVTVKKKHLLQPAGIFQDALRHTVLHPILCYKRELMHRYKNSEIHKSLVEIRWKLKTRPPTGYQMCPVTFCMDLDSRATERKFRELYDEVFSALTAIRQTPDVPGVSPTEGPYFIATTELVLFNQAALKRAELTVPENFNAFVAQSADSVIIVAEAVTCLTEIVREAFRTVYTKTALKYLPLLCLLVCPSVEGHDETWVKRFVSMEAVALRDSLLAYGTFSIPHKVYFVRAAHVLQDVKKALFWLWRHTGVREPRRLIPVSTSTTKKRWKMTDGPRPRRSSMHVNQVGGFTRQRHSIILGKDQVLKPRTGKRVRIDPIPTDMEHVPTAIRSLVDVTVGFTLRQVLNPQRKQLRLSRSLSPEALKAVQLNHPTLFTELMALRPKIPQVKRRVSFKGAAGTDHALVMAQAEAAALAAIQSANLAKHILDEEAAKTAREKFVHDEKKYTELKQYNDKLQRDQKVLLEKIETLVEFVKKTGPPQLVQKIPPLPVILTMNDMKLE